MSYIYYGNDYGREFDIDTGTENLAVLLLDTALDFLECEYEAECSLLITTGENIRRINNENRGIDAETDVLSFPVTDFKPPCNYDMLDEDDYSQFDYDTGRLMLGDIVISYERVLKQAEEYGHTIKRELSFLILHSILHLFGYDHMTDEDRLIMENIQRNILNELGITR